MHLLTVPNKYIRNTEEWCRKRFRTSYIKAGILREWIQGEVTKIMTPFGIELYNQLVYALDMAAHEALMKESLKLSLYEEV
jgi:hypothetical protein